MEKSKKSIIKSACKSCEGKGGLFADTVKEIPGTIKKGVEGAKNVGWDIMDKVERGKLKSNEIPMRYQPDFVKKMHLKKFPETVGAKVGGAIGKGVGFATKALVNPVGTAIGAGRAVGSALKRGGQNLSNKLQQEADHNRARDEQMIKENFGTLERYQNLQKPATPKQEILQGAIKKATPVPPKKAPYIIPDQSKLKNIGVGWGGEKPGSIKK